MSARVRNGDVKKAVRGICSKKENDSSRQHKGRGDHNQPPPSTMVECGIEMTAAFLLFEDHGLLRSEYPPIVGETVDAFVQLFRHMFKDNMRLSTINEPCVCCKNFSDIRRCGNDFVNKRSKRSRGCCIVYAKRAVKQAYFISVERLLKSLGYDNMKCASKLWVIKRRMAICHALIIANKENIDIHAEDYSGHCDIPFEEDMAKHGVKQITRDIVKADKKSPKFLEMLKKEFERYNAIGKKKFYEEEGLES